MITPQNISSLKNIFFKIICIFQCIMKIQFAFISDSSFFLKKYWLYYSLIGQLQASTMDQTLFCAQNKKTSKSILAILNMVGTQVV